MSTDAHTHVEPAIDHRLLKALGHPLRQRILIVLNQRVASPSDLATELDERLGSVSYHVKILIECGAIELVKTEPVRGAVEHFYRAMTRVELDDQSWARLPASIRRELFDQTLQQIWNQLADAGEQGQLDDLRTHISWVPLDLDEEGYAEATEVLTETIDRILEVQARVAGRRSTGDSGADPDADEHRTVLAMLHFHRAAGSLAAGPAAPQPA